MKKFVQTNGSTSTACRFCEIIFDYKNRIEGEAHNNPLFETDSFLIFPSLGGYSIGHVLVVSKLHVGSMKGLNSFALIELELLLSKIRQTNSYKGSDTLIYENGASDSNSGAACIAHAHINIIPEVSAPPILLNTDGEFVSSYISTWKILSPYVMINYKGSMATYDSSNLSVLDVRESLFQRNSRYDWDWSMYPNFEIAEKTIKLWQSLII